MTQAQFEAQAQAIGVTQVKTKFDVNTSTSKIIQTVYVQGSLDPVFSLAKHNEGAPYPIFITPNNLPSWTILEI